MSISYVVICDGGMGGEQGRILGVCTSKDSAESMMKQYFHITAKCDPRNIHLVLSGYDTGSIPPRARYFLSNIRNVSLSMYFWVNEYKNDTSL